MKYLNDAPPADAAWALFFLTGRRLKRHVPTRSMHEWTLELTGLPEWLVEESYSIVGDFAEAIALLVNGRVEPFEPGIRDPGPGIRGGLPFDEPTPLVIDTRVEGVTLAEWIEHRILPLRTMNDEERRAHVLAWWSRLERRELFLLNKLLTGEFRVGVSHTLVVRALAQRASLPTAVVEHRLMGNWEPSADALASLVAPEGPADDPSRPYPFCLASPFEGDIETLGGRDEWLAEWKWDGIRAQLLYRAQPGLPVVARRRAHYRAVPGDRRGRARPSGRDRARRRNPCLRARRPEALRGSAASHRTPAEGARDCCRCAGRVPRLRRAGVRRRRYPRPRRFASGGRGCWTWSADAGPLRVSEEVAGGTWEALAARRDESRARDVEGLMLKRWSSPYRPGRKRGDWWKWKIDPFTVDAVLIYAQPGSGRRASLFTDYTFGVWDGDELVPIAKAYSGLSDEEIDEVDRWVRRHTTERFGPVSAVEPVHVFELGFERIARSTRHKSGVAVRFPRILRWRRDKTAHEADTLETLERMIP